VNRSALKASPEILEVEAPLRRPSLAPASPPVTHALVLAAGRGSRLGGDRPKPTRTLLGVPLLARTLFTLQEAGVTDAYVVLGYGAEAVREAIDAVERLRVRVHWLHNERWDRPNGWSVLTAESSLHQPFFLSMADHVFDASAAERLLEGAQGLEGIDLLVDRDVERIDDVEEATKVRVEDGRIVDIGKSITGYDAIDTGLFLATPALFQALRESMALGGETLSDGVQRLAEAGMARAIDGDGASWQDVDTPEDMVRAERKLLEQLRGRHDGPIARYFNRPISTRISRRIAGTRITPNQVSLGALGVGLVCAAFAAVGGFGWWLVTGLLVQLASILDGVDGEIARLKFQGSLKGEWVDTICDNVSYVVFLIGLTIGAYRTGAPELFVWTGATAVVASFLGLTNINLYLARERSSGSARSVKYGYQDETKEVTLLTRVLRVLHYVGKRDMFSVVILLLAIFGQLTLLLPIVGIGATLLLVPATTKAVVGAAWRRRGVATVTALREES